MSVPSTKIGIIYPRLVCGQCRAGYFIPDDDVGHICEDCGYAGNEFAVCKSCGQSSDMELVAESGEWWIHCYKCDVDE